LLVEISQDSIDLIIAWEVGGGDRELARPQYESKYTRPQWPGNNGSGLTIGIGYDLRYAKSWFEGDWKTRLEAITKPADTYKRLASYVGRGGSRAAERATRDIVIPWEDALAVFRIRRLPHFIEETKRMFPGVESMDAHVWGALTSVIYNCGIGTDGDSRVLKKAAYDAIRAAVAARDVAGVAAGIRALKDFHDRSPKVARGLKRRRDAEAALVEGLVEAETAA
jgi:hypothetical protein